MLGCLFLFSIVHPLTAHSLVEVHLPTVEFRAFHASETHLAPVSHPAGSAHSGSIHHKGVEAHNHRQIKLLTGEGGEEIILDDNTITDAKRCIDEMIRLG